MKKALGLGLAGIGAVALGMAIREVGIKKEKEMLVKLRAVENVVLVLEDHVKIFLIWETIDTEYIMESKTYKKLLDDQYITQRISYYLIGDGDLDEFNRKEMKLKIAELYDYYITKKKIGDSMDYFRETIKQEMEELRNKLKRALCPLAIFLTLSPLMVYHLLS